MLIYIIQHYRTGTNGQQIEPEILQFSSYVQKQLFKLNSRLYGVYTATPPKSKVHSMMMG